MRGGRGNDYKTSQLRAPFISMQVFLSFTELYILKDHSVNPVLPSKECIRAPYSTLLLIPLTKPKLTAYE